MKNNNNYDVESSDSEFGHYTDDSEESSYETASESGESHKSFGDYTAEQYEEEKFVRFLEIKSQSRDAALKKYMTNYWYNEIRSHPEKYIPDKDILKNIERNESQEPRGKKILAWWVTINPDPQISISKFMALTEKTVQKTWVRNYEYVYEFGESGEHPHVHGLLYPDPNNNRSKSKVHRELMSTWNHYVGNDKHIVIMAVGSQSIVEQKRKYMRGEKKDEKYDAKQDKDIRVKHGMEDYYASTVE